MKLNDSISINRRFSRSANIERDSGAKAIEGYIPTGRAIDVVRRIARGLEDASAGRSFSITGPHGGGKSSLAVFLDALFSPRTTEDHEIAVEILRSADPGCADQLVEGLRSINPNGTGAICAMATADRESVARTVARALHAGAVSALGPRQKVVPRTFGSADDSTTPSPREILQAVRDLCAIRPVLIVVDEFGKNLESFAETGGEGDPYLLQELAESAQGSDPLPLVLMTMQHLSFDEYVQETTAARRREWAKVQGRFQDIPYVETPQQARRLIAASIARAPGSLDRAITAWFVRHADTFAAAGLRDLTDEAAACYPLHPLALAVLPSLCSRYGQNERTLFSFLAGAEPLAVPEFLERPWNPKNELEFVGLDRVYDYFLESASTAIGTSSTASRWLEIEGRIRDTTGLTVPELQALKTIGVLNLISSGGSLRASKAVVEISIGGSAAQILGALEARGLITYRDFADEYRVWQGSDFDLRGSVEIARRSCQQLPLADLLNDAAKPHPMVAGRISQERGILRVLDRRFSGLAPADLEPPDTDSPWDGTVLYSTVNESPSGRLPRNSKVVLVVQANDLGEIRETAIEAAALRLAVATADTGQADWVARRELAERASTARQLLEESIADIWGPTSSTWTLLNDGQQLDSALGVSSILSVACERVFCNTPRVANEMIARRELTSQGAKARRMLIESLLSRSNQAAFGIVGHGPDRAIYEAVFRVNGIHRKVKGQSEWSIAKPSDRAWRGVWKEILEAFDSATDERLGLLEIGARLKAPPYGLKDGILPLLIIPALQTRVDDVALYEHGSLVLKLNDAVCERLARNPGHFSVKNAGASAGGRRTVIEQLSVRLGISSGGATPSFLQVARALYREVQRQPQFTHVTRARLTPIAQKVRDSFKNAAEPDSLIFLTLPPLLGLETFPADQPVTKRRAEAFAAKLAETLLEIRGAYESLITDIAGELARATGARGTLDEMQTMLGAQATALDGRVLEPRLSAFVGALRRDHLDGRAWLENLAMVVSGGNAPRVWTDDHAARFHLQIAELGGSLRRTQALLYERLAEGDQQFFTRRLTITAPDGSESSTVVSLTELERDQVGEALESTIERLRPLLGSNEAVRRTALAWLATTEDPVIKLTTPIRDGLVLSAEEA